jgi:DNA-binding FadR family transcriptional regulator
MSRALCGKRNTFDTTRVNAVHLQHGVYVSEVARVANAEGWQTASSSAAANLAHMAELKPEDSIAAKRAPIALADELREAILAGELREGAHLPPERMLATQSNVSRGSVREALRILQAEGLIETRPGRNGGPVVRKPDGESLERPLTAFVRSRSIRLQELVEARLAIETAVARLASDNRTEQDLETLASINERIANAATREERIEANVDWHIALGRASHNELLAAIMYAVSQATYSVTSTDAYAAVPGIRELTVDSHESIRKALEERDADAAERRIRRHILGSAAFAEDAEK